MSIRSPGTWALAGLAGIACAGPDGSPGGEPITEVPSPIINGTPVPVDTLGTPLVTVPEASCSGTLLSDRWLLTARHCVTVDGTIEGRPYEAGFVDAELQNGARAFGDRLYAHPFGDVALVHLDRPLLAPTGRPFANPLHLTTAAGLQGASVYCQGWGDNTTDGQGFGILRSAVLPVIGSSKVVVNVGINSSGQIPWLGDSGSACFQTVDGVPRVLGVHSYHSGTVAAYIAVDVFRDWAEGLMGNAVTLFADPNFTGATQSLLPSGSGGGYYDYERLSGGIGNDKVSSLAVPPFWSATLYDGVGFTNPMETYGGPTPNVASNVNDRTSGAFVSGGVTLYRDQGQYQPVLTLTHAGRYTLLPGTDNLIVSLNVPMGWRVQLFDQGTFSGPYAVFHEGTYRTINSNVSGRVSSIIVEEPVEVFIDPNYSGLGSRLLPGCYDWAQIGLPLAPRIRSIYLPGGLAARVYDASQFSGTLTTLTTSQPTLPANLDGRIMSICIVRI